MKVGKWGNSLAMRLSASVVETLGFKNGDEIAIEIAGERTFRVSRERRREWALEGLKTLQRPLPPGFRFSRDDASER
jgi:antitoxin MazE